MAHQTLDHLFTCLGFVIWGDLGPTTIYRNHKGRVVFFEKTWPHKPPSPEQIVQRARFTEAAAAWQELTFLAKCRWALAVRKASLCMTGYNLFVYWYTSGDEASIRTLERQTRTTLLPT
jgi:hypothetical protein